MPDDREKGKGSMGWTTRSFCGTEQYMAPEMLLQRGHTKGVDWWCLGLLMHEMISGRHPFHGGTHYDTLRNMVSKPPTLDQRLSQPAQSLLKGLLTKDAAKRFGCSPLGAKELQVSKQGRLGGGYVVLFKPLLTHARGYRCTRSSLA